MKYNEFIEGEDQSLRPFIIAEIGVNHEGSMDKAKLMIDQAKAGGADAVKFQSYKAETLASKNSPAYWDQNKEPIASQFELFKKNDSFWKNEFQDLKIYCDQVDIEFMSTPFDIESALFLNDLMNVYKISSSDITNKPFIQYLCQFNKPIILSTGASTRQEIQEAIDWISTYNIHLSLLHCVLNYPTPNEFASLQKIKTLKKLFPQYLIGYSDHTHPQDMLPCTAAVLFGARVIEKHFTFDKSLPGNDHYHAMDQNDLLQFTESLSLVSTLYKSSDFDDLSSQDKAIKNARRSLVSTSDIPKGTRITEAHLTFKRPATGISPKHIDHVIGKETSRVIKEDEQIVWEMLNTEINE